MDVKLFRICESWHISSSFLSCLVILWVGFRYSVIILFSMLSKQLRKQNLAIPYYVPRLSVRSPAGSMMEMMEYIALHSTLSEKIKSGSSKTTLSLFSGLLPINFSIVHEKGIPPTTSLPKRMWHKQRFPKSSAKSRDSKDSPGTTQHTQPSTNRDSIPKDLPDEKPIPVVICNHLLLHIYCKAFEDATQIFSARGKKWEWRGSLTGHQHRFFMFLQRTLKLDRKWGFISRPSNATWDSDY